MRILQIYKDYPPVLGGIEGHLRDLCEGLAARGHEVTALVTSLDARTRIERPRPGLAVLRAARAAHAASTPLSLAMLSLARAARADVVHLHFPYPPGDLATLAVPGAPPLVVTYHSDIVRQRTLLRLYRPLLALTLRRAARIIATSDNYVKSSPFLRPHAAKCAVVPLGVDVRRFAPADERPTTNEQRRPAAESQVSVQEHDESPPPAHSSFVVRRSSPTILFVGRLRYYKGLHLLLEAMPRVDATLLIAGSGPEQGRLAAQAAALGVAGRVRFLGDVPDEALPALYRAADVFVLPAHLRAEAFGIALAEALASGLPCVSTALGTGTSFANLHGVTGLVVPPGDPQALAGALNTLLDNPALRARYGQAARQRALELLSQEKMLDGVEAVYKTLIVKGEGQGGQSPP
ncbi:MAG TPA: glycosyltransferase [Roseiflexaceae bacterium]|nr:glycosyltransferase [Roseiflexaceae bacterium]